MGLQSQPHFSFISTQFARFYSLEELHLFANHLAEQHVCQT